MWPLRAAPLPPPLAPPPAGDGRRAARHLLQWSERQACPDPARFTDAVVDFFARHCDVHGAAGIDLDHVMKSVLRLAVVHELTIDSAYAALAVTVSRGHGGGGVWSAGVAAVVHELNQRQRLRCPWP